MNNNQLMSVDDVLNAVGLTGILLYFLIPTFTVIFVFHIIRRTNQRLKIKHEKTKGQREMAEKLKSGDTEEALKSIKDIEEPKDYKKYSSLNLEFDEMGRVKSEKNS